MGGCSGGNCSSCSSGSCSDDDNDRLPPGMLSRYDLDQDTGLGVLTCIDHDGLDLSSESLSLISRIRESTKDRIFAMITGPGEMREVYDTIFSYGVDTLYHIRCREMETFDAVNYAKALADISERINPMCILLTADARGDAIGDKVSAIIGHRFDRDCSSFSIEGNVLKLEGSRTESMMLISKKNVHPFVASVKSDASYIPKKSEGRKGTAISRPFSVG